MKKLLFSASVALLLFGCGNKDAVEAKNSANKEAVPVSQEPKLTEGAPIEKSVSKSDQRLQTEPKKNTPAEAPAHYAPNQSSIDSIKAAKQKGKK